jgi:hypothetical protein
MLLACEKIERLVSGCCEQTLSGTFLPGRGELEGRRDRVMTCDRLNMDGMKTYAASSYTDHVYTCSILESVDLSGL